jgi:alanine racemase
MFNRKFITYNSVKVFKQNLVNNFSILEKLSNQTIIPVIKSNAYGVGIMAVSQILSIIPTCEIVAVDGYFEALKICKTFKKKILVLGSIDNRNFSIIKDKFSYAVGDIDNLIALSKTGRGFNVHLEFDTGMNRNGFKIENAEDLNKILVVFKNNKKLKLEGVFTHLCFPINIQKSEIQISKFDELITHIQAFGYYPKYIHLGGTGAIGFKSKFSNAIRVGIGLTGVSGDNTLIHDSLNPQMALKPIFEVSSRVSHLVEVKAGESVGYDATYIAKNDTRLAIIPFGYYEGLDRRFSNSAVVKIGENYFNIAGLVCMNVTMIDIGTADVKVGDEVIIFSANKDDLNSISKLSSKFDISPYLLCSQVNENIRRVIE